MVKPGLCHEAPDAILLAGGFGTRLQAIVPNCQKVVAQVSGRPFIARSLDALSRAGVRRIILALGYRALEVAAIVNSLAPKNIEIISSIEGVPMGTGGAILTALPYVESKNALIMNGDSIINYPLENLVHFHYKNNADASILLSSVSDVSRYGRVIVDAKNHVISFEEKNSSFQGPGTISAGVYMMSKELIAKFPAGPFSLERAIFPAICNNGFYGLVTDAPFIDIGTPEDYARAQNFFG